VLSYTKLEPNGYQATRYDPCLLRFSVPLAKQNIKSSMLETDNETIETGHVLFFPAVLG
jgi:hypothetical protein